MPEVSGTANALILFADIIDSSKYSSVLGIKEYARQLLILQELFNNLGEKYFPPVQDKTTSYAHIQARGDEGIIFYADPSSELEDLMYKAVQFSFELKGRIEILPGSENPKDRVPKRMKIGVGIHLGEVALISRLEENRSIIGSIEGFSINYAKRIESCSRNGKYSKIFLSKEATLLLDGDPIVFEKHVEPMKGIENNRDVYEVRSAFFEKMPYDLDGIESEKFIEAYSSESKFNKHDLVNEPWLKGLIISVLDSRRKTATGLEDSYSKKISEIIWQKPTENDPIVLFCRAKECTKMNKHTQRLAYLKRLVEQFPYFVHARKQFVEACYEISKGTTERSEHIFARDIADEFLNRFPDYLSNEEEEKFKSILSDIEKK